MFVKTIFGIFLSEVLHVVVAGDFSDDRRGGDFFNEQVGFFEIGDISFQVGVFEKIDGTVNDNFCEGDFLRADFLNGATRGEFLRFREAELINFWCSDPTETSSESIV